MLCGGLVVGFLGGWFAALAMVGISERPVERRAC